MIDTGSEDEGHLEAIRAAAAERGGIGLVLLTHSHGDHAAGADRLGAEVVLPAGGETHAGLRVLATPGHAADHVCFLSEDGVCFSGDLVLGAGLDDRAARRRLARRLHGLAAACCRGRRSS